MKRYEPVKHTLAMAVCWGLFVGATVVSHASDDVNQNLDNVNGNEGNPDDNLQNPDGNGSPEENNTDINNTDLNNTELNNTVSQIGEIVPAGDTLNTQNTGDVVNTDNGTLTLLSAVSDTTDTPTGQTLETTETTDQQLVPVDITTNGDEQAVQHLSIAILSDTHYVADSQKEGHGEEHMETTSTTEMRMLEEIDSIINVSLDQVKEREPDCLLICGDLTSNGEYSGAEALAGKLNDLKQQEGMEDLGIYVVNGNHDINNSYAADMTGEEFEAAERISPEDFKTVYDGLGYGENDHCEGGYRNVYEPKDDDPSVAQNHGGLSYASEIAAGVTLVVMDTGIYSYEDMENTRYSEAQKTAGFVSDGLLNWVVNETKTAKDKGNLVLGMCHHSIMPHYSVGSSTTEAFMAEYVIPNTKEVCTALADAGMSAVLTGHSHANDIAKFVSENGNVLYDIQTAALCAYPVAWRQVNIDITGTGKDAVYDFSIDTSFIDEDFADVDTSGWTVTTGGQTKSFDEDYQGSMQDYSYVKSGIRAESVEKFIDYYARETAYAITEADGGLEGYAKDKLKISEDESVGSYAEKQAIEAVKKQDKFSTGFNMLGTQMTLTGNRISDGSEDKMIKYALSLSAGSVQETGVLEIDISGVSAGVESIINKTDDYINAPGWKESNYKSSPIQTELTKFVSGALISALNTPIEGSITGMQIALDAQQAFAKGDEGVTQTAERAKYQELLRSDKFASIVKNKMWASISDAAISSLYYPILSNILNTSIAPEGKNTIATITDMSQGASWLNIANGFLSTLKSPSSMVSLVNAIGQSAIPDIYSKQIASAFADIQASFTQDTNIPQDSKWSFHTITLYTGDESNTINSTLTVEDCNAGKLYTPSRENYEFSGWYTAPDGGTLVEAKSDFSKIYKLYAHWNYIGGDVDDDEEYNGEGEINLDYLVDKEDAPIETDGTTVKDYKVVEKEMEKEINKLVEILRKVDNYGFDVLVAAGAIDPETRLMLGKAEDNAIVDLQGNTVKSVLFITEEGNIGINAGTLDYLTPSMIKTLDSVDEDIEIYFMYQGKLIRIMIPKNMDISKYVDKNGFIGFLQLKKIIESGAFVIA